MAYGLLAPVAAMAANWARDLAYQVHATLILLLAGGLCLWKIRRLDEPRQAVDTSGYLDGPIRYGVDRDGVLGGEPEWYVDLWLAIVWVVYLAVFMATIMRRKEPHIYVANWF